MDYRQTLNLPRTDFAMKANLVAREPDRVARWERDRLYERIQAARAGAPRFTLHDGPPFANGDVHIGTAGNKILKDFIVKYRTLRGFQAPYVPGWDCHGLPIEFKVSQEMRKSDSADTGPATIRRACEKYARKFIDLQRTQFKRLGVLGDWQNPYLTLDKEYEADELRLFADIVEKGFVYRGKKPVYWSIPCRTALAEAEVEYRDHTSPSIYVKFPVVGQARTHVLIWTTTPWTLPANLAVAYNSTFSYSIVRLGKESLILSTVLLPVVAEKCGWIDYEIVRSLTGDQLGQIEYRHPFCNRTGKLYPGDEFVENTTGTGFVHSAPGHGLEDYRLGLRVGLPVYSPVDNDGCFTHTDDLPRDRQMPASLLGKAILEKRGVSEANTAVIDELRRHGMLVHREDYAHSYPHCWRSKTPVIFRATDQWFIRMDHRAEGAVFREEALRRIDRVSWIPEWGKERIQAAVEGRPDWCISRQRAWGVPIPAFRVADGELVLDARIVRSTAALVERHGSNVWFEREVADLWNAVKPDDWEGADPVAKSTDTLDVWIDSGSSSRAVLMRRDELRHSAAGVENGAPDWQADLYLEGSDQHRGWFQSSLLLSLAGNDAPPYRTVLTHGFMVDADREKISKSKQGRGGYDKPQTSEAYVGRWGADIVRLWVASQDFRNDIIVSQERIKTVAETYRLIRNTLRYQLANLYDYDPEKDAVPDEQLTGLDRWILGEFARLEADVGAAYDAYKFHTVYQRVSQFAAVELSAIYHDVVKDRLYTDPADSPRRRATQTTLHRLVSGLCQMLAPILAFTADEAWEFVPKRTTASVHLMEWRPTEFRRGETEVETWRQLFALREVALPELERARQAKIIGKALEAKLTITGPPEQIGPAEEHRDALRELLNVSELELAVDDATEAVAFEATKVEGQKCARCWHWETDVGDSAEHPTLCARCVRTVQFQ